jgi:hypothetical protein
MIRDEFKQHLLSEDGKAKTETIARAYSDLLRAIESNCPPGRHLALAKTNAEQSYFWALQAAATDPANIRPSDPVAPIGGGRHG